MKKQLIASHRGLSSIYPENTLEGLLAALPVADYVEFDVVLNKDLDLMICHDTYLSRLSDITNYPQYAERKCKRQYKDEIKDDWWISDFTTQEIQLFKIHQCILKRESQFDNKVGIPLLRTALQKILEYNLKNNTKKGVLLEMKESNYHKVYMNQFIAEHVLKLLKDLGLEDNEDLPIQLMAFDAELLIYSKNNSSFPNVQLIRKEDLEKGLNNDLIQIKQYANILGIDLSLLWDCLQKEPSTFYNNAKKNGFIVYGWTFQDDNDEIMKYFGLQEASQLYVLFEYLDGWITEFPKI